jgi:hypothetical protein
MSETEIIFEALDELKDATANDLANKTGIAVMKVSAALNYLKSCGRAFHVGERPISASREVNLYSTRPKEPECFQIVRQTWYSPLLQ